MQASLALVIGVPGSAGLSVWCGFERGFVGGNVDDALPVFFERSDVATVQRIIEITGGVIFHCTPVLGVDSARVLAESKLLSYMVH